VASSPRRRPAVASPDSDCVAARPPSTLSPPTPIDSPRATTRRGRHRSEKWPQGLVAQAYRQSATGLRRATLRTRASQGPWQVAVRHVGPRRRAKWKRGAALRPWVLVVSFAHDHSAAMRHPGADARHSIDVFAGVAKHHRRPIRRVAMSTSTPGKSVPMHPPTKSSNWAAVAIDGCRLIGRPWGKSGSVPLSRSFLLGNAKSCGVLGSNRQASRRPSARYSSASHLPPIWGIDSWGTGPTKVEMRTRAEVYRAVNVMFVVRPGLRHTGCWRFWHKMPEPLGRSSLKSSIAKSSCAANGWNTWLGGRDSNSPRVCRRRLAAVSVKSRLIADSRPP